MPRSYLLPRNTYAREFGSVRQTKKDTRRANKETVASYLNKRLAEIGVKHVMAIPGDYIAEWVESLDTECNAGLVRIHPNNEMCATYAADGYGRATGGKRVGCVAFTYGVGALNAVQAVAGAFVEEVPLVAINGTPSTAQFNSQRDQGVLWHHMFDGSLTDLRIYEKITHVAVRIDNPAFAADLIDSTLSACITYSKPVYIEIANTLEAYEVQPVSERPKLIKSPVPQNQKSLDESLASTLPILVRAKKLVVLGGLEIARFSLQNTFSDLLKVLKAPYLSSTLGKGILSEYSAPHFSGTYNGKNSQQNVQDLINGADLVLSLGVHETDFNFAGIPTVDFNPGDPPGLPLEATIMVTKGAASIPAGISKSMLGEVYWGNIQLGAFIEKLAELIADPSGNAMNELVGNFPHLKGVQEEMVNSKGLPNAPFPGIKGDVWDIPNPSSYTPTDQVTWDSFKSYLHHNYLNTFSEDEAPVVLADTGLSFYNLNNIKVPGNGYIAQIAWGAIGYSPAASYGVKLALNDTGQSKRRVISVSGDGAFSETSNCLGTIAELGLDNVVFVMANGVFAIEQFLINANAFCDQSKIDECASTSGNPLPKFTALTQVPQTSLMDWKALAKGFGGVGYEVTTNEELANLIEDLKKGSPPPAVPSGPCGGKEGSSDGCCEFDGKPAQRKSTFTLVAVRNVCNDLPSNTKWKLNCCDIQPSSNACP
ncbi:MAG: hypothetical protein GYB31_08630 [Bacteroidetes bacterium]|nr:hypothetical protein [Bacteroidota bacterium]